MSSKAAWAFSTTPSNTYAEVLGPRGHGGVAPAAGRGSGRSLPALAPADAGGDAAQPIDHRRFQLQALMERLAGSEGDIDALMAVKQRDLSSAHDFLVPGRICTTPPGRPEEAFWAERGCSAFPEAGASGCGISSSDAITARPPRGSGGVALGGVCAVGDLEEYRKLKVHAAQGGGGDGRSGGNGRSSICANERRPRAARAADRSPLVEILLADGADDEAWTEAKAGGCRPDLWLRLAARRETPSRRCAARLPGAARTDHRTRRSARLPGSGQLLTRIRALLERLGRADEFGPYRAEVRAAHRQKRSFPQAARRHRFA